MLGARRVEPAGISAGVVHRRPIQWTIYLNPQRDYIAERYEEWAGGLYESWAPREGVDDTTVIAPHVGKPRKSTTTVLEYAKTPTGHWYARKLLTEGDFQGRSGTFMRVVDIDTDYTFPEGLFSPEAFERDLGRTVTTD